MTRPIPRQYNFQIGASIAWVTFLVVLLVWGGTMIWIKDRAAQSACESISEQVGLNDGCQ